MYNAGNVYDKELHTKIKGICDEKKLIHLRQQVNTMYFTQDISKNMIVKEKGVSKKFVIKWTQSPKQDFSFDGRGWRKGMRRKWNPSVEGNIKDIFSSITTDSHHFYTGATAIQQEWLERYQEDPPPLRTIGRILSDLGLSQKRRQQKQKGAAQYLCYPEHTIYTMIGERVLEADFIGKKYMTGRTQPLNFLGFSFKKEPRLRFFTRVEELVKFLVEIFMAPFFIVYPNLLMPQPLMLPDLHVKVQSLQ